MAFDAAGSLQGELNRLRQEHRELSLTIETLDSPGAVHDLELRRLKKQKLALKDRIAQIEHDLLPDIIA